MAQVIVGDIDIFDPRFDTRVIPVNCVGVMGRGVAQEALKRFPGILAPYRMACEQGVLKPGLVLIPDAFPSVWLAATKDDWRKPSHGSWAIHCAETLAKSSFEHVVKDVAVPALGCGLGGLDWKWHGEAIAYALRQGWGGMTFHLSPPRPVGRRGA